MYVYLSKFQEIKKAYLIYQVSFFITNNSFISNVYSLLFTGETGQRPNKSCSWTYTDFFLGDGVVRTGQSARFLGAGETGQSNNESNEFNESVDDG